MGEIYVRGEVEAYQLGKEVGVPLPTRGMERLADLVADFCRVWAGLDEVMSVPFLKLFPYSTVRTGRCTRTDRRSRPILAWDAGLRLGPNNIPLFHR